MSKTPCPDCEVEPGQLHEPYCEQEQCPFCGMQLLTCGCLYRQNGITPDDVVHSAEDDDEDITLSEEQMTNAVAKMEMQGRIKWSGHPMGYHECREFGFYRPDFEVDYMRLVMECRWDRGQQKFVKKVRSSEG